MNWFDVGVNYALETAAGKVVADLNVAHTGRFARQADNRVFQKAFTLVNASLNFSPSSVDWLTLSAWGKNLGDVQYYTVSQEFAGPFGIGGDIAAAAHLWRFGFREVLTRIGRRGQPPRRTLRR